jgi:hypothetical protein
MGYPCLFFISFECTDRNCRQQSQQWWRSGVKSGLITRTIDQDAVNYKYHLVVNYNHSSASNH